MGKHLRLAGQPHDEQAAAIERFIRDEPVLMTVLEGLREDGLPDQLLVAGAIYLGSLLFGFRGVVRTRLVSPRHRIA